MDFEVLLGEKRNFISGGGNNIPSFEIFTSPDWRGTRGIYFADLSSYRSGNYVKGVRLEFKNGRVVKATAEKGQDFLRKMLAMDRGASQIGEFSLTDRRFSKIDKFMADILFDENFGGKHGNCHVAVGSSYADTFAGDVRKLDKKLKEKLGYNESALHWDLINTENKRVRAKLKNGTEVTVYEKGEWQYPAADDEVMVLHTLIVSVRPGHRGSGKEFLKFYEEYAREHGCRYLRLDTNARNQTAREFYRKHEYREIGIVPTVFNGIPGVDLVLLEKKLQISDPDRETET